MIGSTPLFQVSTCLYPALLNSCIACPESPEIERLYEFLINDSEAHLEDLRKFIFHFSHLLSRERQSKLLLKTALLYSPLSGTGLPPLDSLWLMIRALKFSTDHHDISSIQDRITTWECQLQENVCLQRHRNEILSESILNQLYSCTSEEFETKKNELDRILQLGEEWQSNNKINMAIALYAQLTTFIRHQRWQISEESKRCILSLIQNKIRILPNKKNVEIHWKFFREKYEQIKNVSKSTSSFSLSMSQLLHSIFSYVYHNLDLIPPCSFEVLIKGSLAHGEGTRYSDLDCSFLISDPSKKQLFIECYLPHYLAVARFYLGSLDDLWIIESLHTDYPVRRVGGDIDLGDLESCCICSQHCNVLTPKQMIEMIEHESGHLKHDVSTLFNLLFSTSLFAPTQDRLFGQFQEMLKRLMKDNINRNKVFTCLKTIEYKNFSPLFNQNNLKKGWLHRMKALIYYSSLFFGYGIDPFETLKGYIPNYFLNRIEFEWNELLQLRWKMHATLEHTANGGNPNEFLKPGENQHSLPPHQQFKLPALSQIDVDYLKEIKNNVLPPFYELLNCPARIDPLLAYCQEFFPKIQVPEPSKINSKVIIEELIAKKIPYQGICERGYISKVKIDVPRMLEDWLIEEYLKLEFDKRILWLYKLLQMDLLYYWIDPFSFGTLIEKIANIPLENGHRIAQDLEWAHFCSECKQMLQSISTKSPTSIAIMTLNLDDPFCSRASTYSIDPKLFEDILDERGQCKDPHPTNSLHTVLPFKKFWIKFCPEQPAMEYFAWNLAWHLAGGGIPPSLILKLKFDGRTIAAILSKHVEGPNMAHGEDKINRISLASFTQHQLRVFATCPEDDRPEHYFLSPHLKSIDNDRFLCQPVETGWFSTTINFKSVILFHDLMKERPHLQTIQNFKRINIYAMNQKLLNDLASTHDLYRNIFTFEEVQEHFNPSTKFLNQWKVRSSGLSLLTVVISPNWLENLLGHLYLLKSLPDIEIMSGHDILRAMHPQLSEKVQEAFSKHSSCLARLDSLDAYIKKDGQRTSRVSALKMSFQSLGRTITVDEMREVHVDQNPTIKQARLLLQRMEKDLLSQTLTHFNQNDRSFLTTFSQLFTAHQMVVIEAISTRKSLTAGQQQLFLRALSVARTSIVSLNFPALKLEIEEKELVNILKKHGRTLLSLDLSGLHLKNTIVDMINRLCPALKILKMNGCLLLNHFRADHLNYLAQLFLEGCTALSDVDLTSHHGLEIVSLKGCTHLSKLKIRTLSLRKVDLRGCDNNFLVKFVRQHPKMVRYFHEDLKCNRDFILDCLRANGTVLKYLSAPFRDDLKMIKTAIIQSHPASKYVPESKANDSAFMQWICDHAASSLPWAPKTILLAAIKKDKAFLKYAIIDVNQDFFASIRHQYPDFYLYAPAEFMLAAIKFMRDGVRLLPLRQDLMQDQTFLLNAIRINKQVIRLIGNFLSKELALKIVKQDGLDIQFLPDTFQEDRRIALAALKQNPHARSFIPLSFLAVIERQSFHSIFPMNDFGSLGNRMENHDRRSIEVRLTPVRHPRQFKSPLIESGHMAADEQLLNHSFGHQNNNHEINPPESENLRTELGNLRDLGMGS